MENELAATAHGLVKIGIPVALFFCGLMSIFLERRHTPLKGFLVMRPYFFLMIIAWLVNQIVKTIDQIEKDSFTVWIYGDLLYLFILLGVVYFSYRNLYRNVEKLQDAMHNNSIEEKPDDYD